MNFYYGDIVRQDNYPAYERLLLDCIKGDQTLFARQDGIEAMWAIVDPIIKYWDKVKDGKFPNYDAGTWGPKAADELVEEDGLAWDY
jgi:glucose-6-phosphate 1-dehydrogenase